METENRKLFLLIIISVTVGIFLYLARRVVTPFIIAFVLAYLLDPLVDLLESKQCSRTLAVVLLMGTFFSLILTAVVLLLPVLQDQVERLAHNVPRYIDALEEKITPLIWRDLKIKRWGHDLQIFFGSLNGFIFIRS